MENKLTYIICGKLYNGIDDELKEHQKILIQGKYIKEVGADIPQPENAEVIDLSAYTVTPGMIDAHMHMDQFDWHTVREEAYANSEEMKTLGIVRCAKKTLERGFTTVRHIGGITSKGYGAIDAKKCIERGFFDGSRLVVSPLFLCSAGSHGDLSQGYASNPRLASLIQATDTTLGSGGAFFANAVREEIKYGADFIKIMATGGFFTPNDSPSQQQLNDEELKAIMETTHELGKTVTAHVYGNDLMQKLIKFGIDGMEHCSLMNEETAQMIVDHNVYVVPTFCPYEEAVHYDAEKMKDKQPEFRAKLELYKEALQAGREIIRKSKCTLGYGTDFVANHYNYESGYEYESWLKSDMDPYRALKAATSVNAKILELDDKIGTLEPGKYADVSAWGRDLLTDPKALLDCAFVMKEGVAFDTVSCLD